MNTAIKIVLAILMVLCLADMPYGYYQFVRFAAMAGFIILAYESLNKEKTIEGIVFISLALLFQPFFKIALGRLMWNIVDVVVGVGLIISLFVDKKENR